jgi:hypothetical protein
MAGPAPLRRAGGPGRHHGSLWKKGLVFYRREGDGRGRSCTPSPLPRLQKAVWPMSFPDNRLLAGGGRVGGEYRDADQAVGAVNGCSAGPG